MCWKVERKNWFKGHFFSTKFKPKLYIGGKWRWLLEWLENKGEDVLRKRCKEVTELTPKIVEIVEDMLDTMYEANGVGLAAPQVGILKRIVVIDIGEGPIVLINPEIIETSGKQTGNEGCLSVPGKVGVVTRPNYVKAKAIDITGTKALLFEGEELMS